MYKISEKETEALYQKLILLSVKNTDNKMEMSYEDAEECHILALASYKGKQLYKSLTDEQLLGILRQIADKLGYSPSQKEVFWVLREYIKLRFKKWPYALTTAGLHKSAGCGGKKKFCGKNDLLKKGDVLDDFAADKICDYGSRERNDQ